VAEGKRRVAMLKTPQSKAYPKANLYGETELGGLHVLYVLADSPEVYGLPVDPQLPIVNQVRDILNPLRWVAWGGMAAVLLVNLIVARARQNQGREEM
jgi:formate dehydrogenase iron-sulfur subunit